MYNKLCTNILHLQKINAVAVQVEVGKYVVTLTPCYNITALILIN